tara:strand:+ start:1347 stop:1760 length:414 start_codon:yes stop_codon:yes gene_type:complete
MKNTKNRKENVDFLAEIKNTKEYTKHAENADVKIKTAVEIYKARKELGISQQELAKKIESTQKVISKIENADVNIGSDLLYRITKVLNLQSDTLGRIFDCDTPVLMLTFPNNENNTEVKNQINNFITKKEEIEIQYK